MSAEGQSDAVVRFARLVAAFVFAVSLFVLAGGLLEVPMPTRIMLSGVQMAQLTAITFTLTSVSLWFAIHQNTSGGRPVVHPEQVASRWIYLACAGLVTAIGVVRLAAHLFGWDAESLDRLMLRSSIGQGRTSPATAVAFAMLGGALLVVRRPQLTRTCQLLAISPLLIGWLGVARYVFGGVALIPFANMAIHTAVLLLLLSAAVLSLRKDVGLIALLYSDGAGGAVARRLLPAALLLPVLAGALAVYSEHAGWLALEASFSLFALSSMVVFTGLVWASAVHLERVDQQHRETRQALHLSEERTRLIIETALDAVITMDGAGIITGWSARAESLFGWASTEVVGRTLAETIIPDRLREAHAEGLRRYLATGAARVLNRRLALFALHRDQREFPVEISIAAIRGGGDISFSAFVQDITERTRAEAALRESQRLLQSIVDNSQAVIYVKSLEGRYVLVNRRYEEIFHLSRERVLGRTDHELFSAEVAEAFRNMDTRVAAGGEALTEVEAVPQADGVHAYVSVKAPLRDAEGRITGIFGISTDITESKQAEERLRTQLARLNLLDQTTRAIGERQDLRSIFQVVIRSLEEHLPVDFACVCLYEPSRGEVSINCVGVKSAALARELALPERARIAVDENGLGRCVRGQLVYEPDISGSTFLFPSQLSNHGMRSLVLAPLLVERKVFGALIVARRATEGFSSGDCEFMRQLSGHVALAAHQAQLYAALQNAYEDLRQSQQTVMQQERLRALGQMASGIAHDINNALSPASLYIQSLLDRDTSLSKETRDYLTIADRAIEDVAETVARMREFSRPREAQLTLMPVDLNVVVRQVIDLTHARWSDMPQERGILIRLHRELAESLPRVLGAQHEIRDALTNLVLNAVDAMPEGGILTVRSRGTTSTLGLVADPSLATHVLIEIGDTGIGMSEAVRNRCLEPFFTTKGERGTGLGLAMVYGMAQRHSADLDIDSVPGTGTAVRLIFPVAVDGAVAVSAVAPPRLEPLHILVVDDDPLILRSLQDALEQDGHQVDVADGGQAGIDQFCAAQVSHSPIDVVITDLGMPQIDGRTVASAVKSLDAAAPVILLTGWGYRMRAEGELPEHVDRVLSKPPKLSELRATLADLVCERPRTQGIRRP